MKFIIIICFFLLNYNIYGQVTTKVYNIDETTFHLFDSILYLRSNMTPLTGTIRKYDSDKKIVFECNYINGIKDGSLKAWCSNGVLVFSATYKKGIPDGLFQWWYYNGKLKAKCNYLGGLLNGKCEEWYENHGQLKYEENYLNDKMIGVQRYFSENGKYLGGGELVAGNGRLFFYYSENKIAIEAEYNSGYLDGQVKFYTVDGKIEKIHNYTLGILNGVQQEWYNGKLVEEINFKFGKINGLQKIWSDGKLIEEHIWENSEEVSSKFWNENSELIEAPDFDLTRAFTSENSYYPNFEHINYLNLNKTLGRWCEDLNLANQLIYLIFDDYGGMRFCTYD